MKKVNETANNLLHSSYWQYQVEQHGIDELLFGQLFAKTIKQDTKFVYMAFVDEKKDIFKTGWSAYEDQDKLLGFLEHVYLPILMFNWYDQQSEGFFIPVATIEEIRDALGSYMEIETAYKNMCALQEMVQGMKSKEEVPVFVDMFEKRINNNYRNEEKIAFVKVFDDIHAVNRFLKEEMPVEDIFQEEMGMSVGNFDYICNHIDKLPFVTRVLISQLNQKIAVTGF